MTHLCCSGVMMWSPLLLRPTLMAALPSCRAAPPLSTCAGPTIRQEPAAAAHQQQQKEEAQGQLEGAHGGVLEQVYAYAKANAHVTSVH